LKEYKTIAQREDNMYPQESVPEIIVEEFFDYVPVSDEQPYSNSQENLRSIVYYLHAVFQMLQHIPEKLGFLHPQAHKTITLTLNLSSGKRARFP
jgi:hypothetical protein